MKIKLQLIIINKLPMTFDVFIRNFINLSSKSTETEAVSNLSRKQNINFQAARLGSSIPILKTGWKDL